MDAGGPHEVDEGESIALNGTVTHAEGGDVSFLAFEWDVDSDGVFETSGASATFLAPSVGSDTIVSAAFRGCNSRSECVDDTVEITIRDTQPKTFADFAAVAEIETGADGEFEIRGAFTLGIASDGIDPQEEDVVVNIGVFELTLPAGSLEFRRKGGADTFQFEGDVNGIELELRIRELGPGAFDFRVEAKDVNLDGISNPVRVILTIGNDSGELRIQAEIEGDEDDKSDKSEKSNKSEKSDKSNKSGESDKSKKSGKSEKSGKGGREG